MTVCNKNTELLVFGGANWDHQKALLQSNALQTGLPARSCKPHAHSQDGRQAHTIKAVWFQCKWNQVVICDRLEGLHITYIISESNIFFFKWRMSSA